MDERVGGRQKGGGGRERDLDGYIVTFPALVSLDLRKLELAVGAFDNTPLPDLEAPILAPTHSCTTAAHLSKS